MDVLPVTKRKKDVRPSDDGAGIERVRKGFTRFLLDNRGSGGLLTFILIAAIVGLGFITVSLMTTRSTHGEELRALRDNSVGLQTQLQKLNEDKRQLEQTLNALSALLEEMSKQPPPPSQQPASAPSTNKPPSQPNEQELEKTKKMEQELQRLRNELSRLASKTPPPSDGAGVADIERQDAVRAAMLHAWNGYKRYAWGRDELRPISHQPHGWLDLGLTIVDSLDTLWIMGLKEQFDEARDWVKTSMRFDKNAEVSFFETVIRVLGGLLSTYDLTGDELFLERAEDIGGRLLEAFNTPSGIPLASINLVSKQGRSPSWTGGASILAEIGTVQLEYLHLAYHTNKPRYAIKPLDVFRTLDALKKDDGLYPLYIHPNSGKFQGGGISFGAMGDSFYEYMLKLWLFTGRQASGYRRMYDESINGCIKRLVQLHEPSGLTYVGQSRSGTTVETKMEHLTCFVGGMMGLGASTASPPDPQQLELAGEITRTCHMAYNTTRSGLGPEYFVFPSNGPIAPGHDGSHNLLRPETVESYFVMWRLTHDPKYREWGWQAFQAFETYSRTDAGYTGLHNVNSPEGGKDDVQQSFFMAETLKYLYLLFSDDDLIPLDKWVFNTEAHPLRIIDEPLDSWPQEIKFHLLLA